MASDPQVVELLGRNLLVTELLRAGLEVALPIRDRGIDLIAYADTGEDVSEFGACPIQMKAASDASFSINSKYRVFPGLLIAYVWNVARASNAVSYALTHEEALAVAEQMGYTQTASWKAGIYSCTRVGSRLLRLLEPYRMTPEKWRAKIVRLSRLSTASLHRT
jgi:hypothetical protein